MRDMKKLLAFLFALLATPVAAQTIPSGAWGSINYWGVGGLSQVLAPGLAGQCLTTQNVGSAPIWVNCQVSSLSLLPPINANSIMANNTLNFVAPQAIDVNRVLDMVGYDIIRPPLPESIIYKSNVGPNFNWQTLPPGVSGALLTSGGPTNPPFWAPTATQANLASICTTIGAMLYFDTPSLLWKCLNPGTSGQLLQTGGAAGNPSWLTVTLATLGGVPSTRNVNTSSPLGGGGALSADLTLTCPTCATTTNGGALSATAPETISAAGVIACPTCATTTNGGALSATAPATISSAGVIAVTGSALTSSNDTNVTVVLGGTPASALLQPTSLTMGWAGTLAVARGGTGAGTQAAAAANIFPTPTRAGDVAYWNGSAWVTLAGNSSGTNVLQENSSGVPSWAAPGTGTVTSVTCGTGLSGGTFTVSGTCAVPNQVLLNTLTASNSATLSDTTSLTATYSAYDIVFQNVLPATGATTLELQVNSGGVQSTSYITNAMGTSNGSATILIQAPTTFIPLSNATAIGNTGSGVNGTIRVSNPSSSSLIKTWVGTLSGGAATLSGVCITSGYWNNIQAISGFQVLFSSGNITSGVIKIYGIQ